MNLFRKLPNKSVLVLHEAIAAGARADELDTLIQVDEISRCLRGFGFDVSVLQTDLDLETTMTSIRASQPACVFNLVESLGGDGCMVHFIPSMLRAANIPFSGSDSDAIYLSSQKNLAKQWMRFNGISTPTDFVPAAKTQTREDRWIVKSRWEHASFGMDDGCVVSGSIAAQARIDECIERYGGEWFAEHFIEGREFNISVFEYNGEPYVLPVAEINFIDYPKAKPRIVGYAAKWDENSSEYHATQRMFPDLDDNLSQALQDVALRCWNCFGLRGYARVDVRVDSQDVVWVLEVNANPCLARDAGFVAAASQDNISYEQVIRHVLQTALPTTCQLEKSPGKSAKSAA